SAVTTMHGQDDHREVHFLRQLQNLSDRASHRDQRLELHTPFGLGLENRVHVLLCPATQTFNERFRLTEALLDQLPNKLCVNDMQQVDFDACLAQPPARV